MWERVRKWGGKVGFEGDREWGVRREGERVGCEREGESMGCENERKWGRRERVWWERVGCVRGKESGV